MVALVILVFGLASCGAGEVERAEARWDKSAVADYRIHVREFHSIWCFYDIHLEVWSSEIVSGTVTAHFGPAQLCGYHGLDVVDEPVLLSAEKAAQWTVSGLFETAHQYAEWVDKKDMEIVLEFDPDPGYPMRLAHDNVVAYDDDGLAVEQFERLEP